MNHGVNIRTESGVSHRENTIDRNLRQNAELKIQLYRIYLAQMGQTALTGFYEAMGEEPAQIYQLRPINELGDSAA